MDMLTTLIGDGLGYAVTTFLAKLVGRVAGRRRARVQAFLERFGELISDLRALALLLLLVVAAFGAGIVFGYGPAFVTLGLLAILTLATGLISRLCRAVAERMEAIEERGEGPRVVFPDDP